MIRKTRFHCWRDAQALVYLCEIVPHELQGDGDGQVFNLWRLPESLHQPGVKHRSTNAHVHSIQIGFVAVAGRLDWIVL